MKDKTLLSLLKTIKFEYKITLTYLTIGFLWIIFSDELLDYLVSDDTLLTKFQTFKGSFYIIVTSLLLLFLVKRHIKNLKSEELLRIESESRYKSLFYENNSIMLLTDLETFQIADANNAALEYYGYNRLEITTLRLDKINILPIEELKELLNKVSQRHFNFKHQLKSGELRDVEVYAGKVFIKGKDFLYSIVHDVTDKKRNEEELHLKNQEYATLNEEYISINEELRKSNSILQTTNEKLIQSEEQFRLLIENAPIPIFIQTHYRFTYVNKLTLKLYGAESPKDLLGTQIVKRVPVGLQDFVEKRITVLNKETKEVSSFEYTHLKMDNTPIPVEVMAVPIVFDNDNGALVFVRDITERKKFIQEIEEARKKAEESDQLKTAFMENISHEIRTPMNAIQGFSELLRNPSVLETKRELYTNILQSSVNQLLNIIENMITLAHLQTQQLKINTIELSPNNLLCNLYDEFKEIKLKTNKSHVHLVLLLTSEADIKIFNDSTRIQQVLKILLDNALKFTEKGKVEFGYSLTDTRINFFVKDTGIGIPIDKQKIIFESFMQADKNTRIAFGGLGVGLTIANGLTKLLGGTLEINSVENNGTEIIVSLPLK